MTSAHDEPFRGRTPIEEARERPVPVAPMAEAGSPEAREALVAEAVEALETMRAYPAPIDPAVPLADRTLRGRLLPPDVWEEAIGRRRAASTRPPKED